MEMREWMDTVRAKLAPAFTIGPEMLTHHKAVDLTDGKPLEKVAERVAAHLAERVERQSFEQILHTVIKDKASFPKPQFYS